MDKDLTTLLLVLAPATLVLAATYMVLKRMLDTDQQRRQLELRINTHNETVKIRLHAIGQLAALVERLSPSELVLRTTRNAATVAELQMLLLDLVRKEMNDYISFQLYVSIDTWLLIVSARNEVQSLINRAAAELRPDEPAIHLSKKIIDTMHSEAGLPTDDAMDALRKETQRLFT